MEKEKRTRGITDVLLILVITILAGTVLILACGASPMEAYGLFFRGIFGTPAGFAEIFVKACPLILTGLGCAVAYRTGFFNIGAEGQFYVGAMATTIVALNWTAVPGIPRIILSLVIGFLAGGVWALIAAVCKAKFNISEIIVTIMLNYIAINFLGYAVPLMYGGIGETIAEKSGILNIGMEGVMLSGAFFSFAGAWYSGNLFVGLLCGMAGGLIVSLLHGLLSITLIQNQSVSGLAINMLMLGVTSFLFKLMSNGQGYQQIETFPNIAVPGLSKIPLIGDAFFNCDFLTYILYVLLILTWIFYKKTNLGLSFMAVGEHPRAAESAGIQVKKYRWIVMVFNGILGGIGGAYLVLVQLGVFTENMISGRGYIALATVILGRYTPFGMFGAALLFGAANALQIRLQTIGVSISPFLLAILPYALTLIAMLGAAGKNSEPEALAKPYVKGSR